jgi:phage FluMu protein Com
MDATRCPHCNRRMKAVTTTDGRTDLKCLRCDEVDPLQTDAVKWAESPLAAAGWPDGAAVLLDSWDSER